MNRLGVSIVGLWVCAGLAAPAVAARPAACCRTPAGTVVQVELTDAVSTKTQKSGDAFAFRLAQPLIVNGRIVLRTGTPGVGEVIESAKPGLGGKAAKLVLVAKYLKQGRRRVPLRGMQLAAAGRGNVAAAQAVGLTGIAFGPLGLMGFAVKGGDAVFPAGTLALAKVSVATTLPPLGRAPAGAVSPSAPDVVEGSIQIPPPPAGQGQVVFFRSKSILGTGQWFNVREGGQALGKLTNGAYFVQTVAPGLHTYTAKTEPEFNDRLKIQVDPGETYFVEGMLTKGVIIGAADLAPSNRAAFNKAAKTLKPAAQADADTPPAAAQSAPAAPAASPAG
jgi:hypothetical protein